MGGWEWWYLLILLETGVTTRLTYIESTRLTTADEKY